ncbi:hypothetical protein CBM2634_U160001 [Cupriavidus taiwanensis]|uniref:Uncharacterized protein n=1 Tax=Cupriavidus taiwanensis TaxID=164546 RepID=A0A375JEX7_9BURK|nr:hypothetical protein CBM2634_U160001 [Cupriavidus taiwanensis]
MGRVLGSSKKGNGPSRRKNFPIEETTCQERSAAVEFPSRETWLPEMELAFPLYGANLAAIGSRLI